MSEAGTFGADTPLAIMGVVTGVMTANKGIFQIIDSFTSGSHKDEVDMIPSSPGGLVGMAAGAAIQSAFKTKFGASDGGAFASFVVKTIPIFAGSELSIAESLVANIQKSEFFLQLVEFGEATSDLEDSGERLNGSGSDGSDGN